MSKFSQTLRSDLKVRRSGFLGLGRKVEVSGAGLKYSVDRRNANADMAQHLNSKIPFTTLRKPL